LNDAPTNILCIGTTGMLLGFTQTLLKQGHRMLAIARTCQSLDRCAEGLTHEQADRLSTEQTDYTDEPRFERLLDSIPDPIEAVICWIHSSAPNALDQVRTRFPDADMLRVCSHSTPLAHAQSAPHRCVILGSTKDNGSTRWLTHDEISLGVLKAFQSTNQVSIVGSIDT
tara:strand:- start:128179 stop:128688 length:510 start_codon:yes stop_codon:yes gene_type:complete